MKTADSVDDSVTGLVSHLQESAGHLQPRPVQSTAAFHAVQSGSMLPPGVHSQ